VRTHIFWHVLLGCLYLHILFPSSSLLLTLLHSNLPVCCVICDSILLGILYHWQGLNQFWTILSNSICQLQEVWPVSLCWLIGVCVCVCVCLSVCVCVSYIRTVSSFIFWVAEINMCITLSPWQVIFAHINVVRREMSHFVGQQVKPFCIFMLCYL